MILVTGATGFLGRYLIKNLSKKEKVRILVRKKDYIPNVEVVYGDLLDLESLYRATKNINQVVHLAAIQKQKNTKNYYKVNVEGTENLVRACKKNKIKKIIYVSSIAARNPELGHYNKSKFMAEEIIKKSKIKFVILRPTVIYGKGDRDISNFIEFVKKYFIIPIISSGKLQPVYVGDVSKGIVNSLKTKKNGVTYELGGLSILNFEELVDLICKESKIKRLKIRIPFFLLRVIIGIYERIFKDPKMNLEQLENLRVDKRCDINKAIKDLDFKPREFDIYLVNSAI